MSAVRKEDYSVADLQHYLRAWAWKARQWKMRLGYPTQAPFVRIMRPVVAWDSSEDQSAQADEAYSEISGFVFDAIEAEIERLPSLKRAALKLIYLREVDYAVYRNGHMTVQEAHKMTNETEVELVPKLRARGVVLGGK